MSQNVKCCGKKQNGMSKKLEVMVVKGQRARQCRTHLEGNSGAKTIERPGSTGSYL
jgi:hypothetical protein